MKSHRTALRNKAPGISRARVEPIEPRLLLSASAGGSLLIGGSGIIAQITATGTVTGTVYNDSNGNGIHDPGETGAAGITVYDDVNNDRILDNGEPSTVTAADGSYTLTNVPVGAAIIRESIPAGVAQTFPTMQYGNHLTITAGSVTNAVNFEQVIALGTITGTVFNDANQNGVQDSGEAGLANWSVYIDLDNVGHYVVGDPVPMTNAAGQYSFLVGAPATYIVRVFAPAGNVQSYPALNFGQHITLGAGQTASGVNFGFYQIPVGTGSISGTVTLSGGSPAPAGWTLYLDYNNNGKFDNGEITTVTTTGGAYTFTNLAAGTYIVRVITPAGYGQVTPTLDYGNHVTLTAGQSVSGQNFTYALADSASISGTVFNDANGNGILDNGETGIAGVSVYIDLDNSGAFAPGDPVPTTDANGNFTFSDLPAGTYIVRVETPAGYAQTFPADNYGNHITLAVGQAVTNVRFGEKTTT